MKLLAIETTATVGSLAFLSEGELVRDWPLPSDKRSAATLAAELQRALRAIGWGPKDIQLVAVSMGPGSFTGVRIGLVTAKLFAYAVGARLFGVNSLDAVVETIPGSYSPLIAIADAQRGEITAKVFVWDSAIGWQTREQVGLVRPEAWVNLLPAEETFWFTGPGLYKYREILGKRSRVVPEAFWNPTAVGVARVAWKRFLDGESDDVWTLKPIYYRPSYAEEKRLSG
jgi:tRNA threonylcarbamoyladenosine biosynthesis protein TsaB